MKTIVLQKPGQFIMTDTPAPGKPQAGQALLRVRSVGICGSDLHAYTGRHPSFSYTRILGHELGVEVLEVGPDAPGASPEANPGVKAGDICSVEPSLTCGTCIACRRGRSNCCESLSMVGVHSDGGMREMFTMPLANLHPSRKLGTDQLALVEMMSIGCHAVSRAALERGERALVIGAGPIGLSVIQFATQVGAKVMVMDVNHQRLEFARQQFPIDTVIDAAAEPLAAVQKHLGGELPTVVFEATGNAQSMNGAYKYVANSGKLVFVGVIKMDLVIPDIELHRRELTIMSSRNSVAADFRSIIKGMEDGRINTKPWITHRCQAGEMIGQFPSWSDPKNQVVKAVVEF